MKRKVKSKEEWIEAYLEKLNPPQCAIEECREKARKLTKKTLIEKTMRLIFSI